MRPLLPALSLLLVACGGGTLTYGEGNLRIELTNDRLLIHDHIQFAHDSAQILEASYPLLDMIVVVLADNTRRVAGLHVHGYTSAVGEEAHNLQLSQERAAAVVRYLEDHGVSQRLESSGHGEEFLLCQEDTEGCHAQNRRVEFFVIHR